MYLGLSRGLGGRSRGEAWTRDARAWAMEMERGERLGCEFGSGLGCWRKWERGARRSWSKGDGDEEGSRRLRGQSVTLRGKRSEGCFAAVALCVPLLRLDRRRIYNCHCQVAATSVCQNIQSMKGFGQLFSLPVLKRFLFLFAAKVLFYLVCVWFSFLNQILGKNLESQPNRCNNKKRFLKSYIFL